MNRTTFDAWADAINLDPMMRTAFYSTMVGYPNADIVLKSAAKGKWSSKKMTDLLRTQGQDVGLIEQMMDESSVPVPPEGFTAMPMSLRAPAPRDPRRRNSFRPNPRHIAPASDEEVGDELEPAETPRKEKKPGLKDKLASQFTGPNKKWWIGGGIVLLLVLLLAGYLVYSSLSGPKYDFSSTAYPTATAQSTDPAFAAGTTATDPNVVVQVQEAAPLEVAPVAPPSNPLNFKGSMDSRGFLGKVQSLIFVVGLGILAALIGDIVYREQWWDGITAVLTALVSIVILFPVGTVWWIGLFFFLLELYLVWFAAFQGGQDYSPLAAYFLLVGVFGGLMATQIAAVQNIFVSMTVFTVPPIISLGYYFQTMNLASLAFPFMVYLFVLIGVIITVVECVRPSGEDRSSRWGSLGSAAVGLFFYFVFLHGVGLVPWISFMIALLISAGGSAALRSQPAKQFVTPVWGVRSPFDGAMLLAAIILVLLVIFGQQWWLIGVL